MAKSDFERVFAAHVEFVWRVLTRQGLAEADIPDACQEVFLVVHRKLPTFEGKSTLRTWIYGICRGVAANWRRRAHRRREVVADVNREVVSTSVLDDGFERLACQEAAALLLSLLQRLSPVQREVFVLYEIEGWTLQEVAESTSSSRSTAFARLQMARRIVASELRRLQIKRRVA